MPYRYFFTFPGKPAAALVGDNLFSLDGEWLGLQDEEGNIWDPEGYFLGTPTRDDRLVRPKDPKGPPFFRSPRTPPPPPEDLRPPAPREPVSLPPHLLDALEGLG